LVEVERAAGDLVTGTADDNGRAIARASARRGQNPPVRWVNTRLVAAFERGVDGDDRAVLEDADLVGADMDIDNATAGGVRDAVKVAATLTIPSCETRRSSLRTAR
jgi:hypothetical protein